MGSTTERGDLLGRLARHRTLGVAPHDELAWLATNGEPHSYAPGAVTTRKGQPEEWLQVVLSGHLTIHVDRGAGSRKIIEWRTGDVCGLMPYSRGGTPPGDTVAEELTDTLAVPRDRIPEMIRECPRVTTMLVHAMLDRARHFTSSDSHDEKLVALGRLAAGLAHELNNPASAALRSVKMLIAALADADAAAIELEAAELTGAQRASIAQIRAACLAMQRSTQSPLERADREDALAAWLSAHDVDDASAETLADATITTQVLESLVDAVPAAALGAVIQSIAAACAVRALTADIEAALTRVHDLVAAVKGFTFMDRAPTAEPTDVSNGIRNTLAVLGAKIRDKAVGVEVQLASDLPRVLGLGGELNQVWLNLVDNALDAVAPSGHVLISASHDRTGVVVCIIDDGAGIPPEIKSRIFDPFFTTKGVGHGTGLGLDIVRRLVQRHDGEIEVASQMGHTEFRVRLPAAPG